MPNGCPPPPPAAPRLRQEELPIEYAMTEALVDGMLRAAHRGDHATLGRLHQHLPALAEALRSAWRQRRASDPLAAARLETERIQALSGILRIDAQLRRLLSRPLPPFLDQALGRTAVPPAFLESRRHDRV